MSPPSKKRRHDDLTIDATAKLFPTGTQAHQEPRASAYQRPAKKPHRGVSLPTPPVLPPPRAEVPPWARRIETRLGRDTVYMALYDIVWQDRLPKRRFCGHDTQANTTFPVSEPIFMCESLRKRVPQDLCHAACTVAARPYPGPRLYMHLVAEELKAMHIRAATEKRRLEEQAEFSRLQAARKAEAERFRQLEAEHLQKCRLARQTEAERNRLKVLEHDAVVILSEMLVKARANERERETMVAIIESTDDADAAESDSTLSHTSSEDDDYIPETLTVSKDKKAAEPRMSQSGGDTHSRQARAIIHGSRDQRDDDGGSRDKKDDPSPLPEKRVIRPTAKAISKRKVPAVHPRPCPGTHKLARQSSSAPEETTLKQCKAGPSRPARSLYNCSCEKDSHDPADLHCGFRLEVNWSHVEKDKLCFLKGDLGVDNLKWATVGKILGREDSVRQYWMEDRPIRKAYDSGTFEREPLWTIDETDFVVQKRRDGVEWNRIGAALKPQRSELACQMQYRQWLLIKYQGLKKAEKSFSSSSGSSLFRDGTEISSQQSTPTIVNNGSHSGSGTNSPPGARSNATNHNVGNDAWEGLRRRSSKPI